MEFDFFFNNKTVVITGGSTGIGRMTALAFARAGAKVALIDLNQKDGEQTLEELRAEGTDAEFYHCSVDDPTWVRDTMTAIEKRFRTIDIAFNNAGIEGTPAATHETTEEEWNRVIGINLSGVWHSMRYELPIMLKHGGGSIVNCASIAGVVGFQSIAPYVASKHGVVGLTKAAALEYAKSHIRVNAVCPGVIRTAMIDRFTQGNKEAEQALISPTPLGRMGTTEEIAGTVLWLSSPQAGFVTGAVIVADGGWTAQ